MGEYPHDRPHDRRQDRDRDERDADQPQQSLQEIAHDRGRICKKRGCVVCAPLVEQRRLKKQQRKAAVQARQHAKGQPCGRASCSVATCVEARQSPAPVGTKASEDRSREADDDPNQATRRQAERHRVELPCGSEDCPIKVCVDGFANERKRRHRAGRPCRSSVCDNAICVAGRATA